MAQNVGSMDRKLRTVVGAVAGLVSLGTLAGIIGLPEVVSPLLGIVALMMLATAAAGTCGLYSVLGVDTCSMKSNRSS